ncbi:hypothetical protein [Micromonospora sagamiensis]|uniref:Uncharacterized protein n=1 Tax=Micromonospora sagamiensis TaxID=47875 RepID=A0A562W9M5_9ACTN|nr:hypothetical protein [Micromonospora sagamiensis]TWJ26993.1 hypothetical protein JD81_00475 [Micromonospora sagamiensis]BCL14117.1 hypothetical protein GCM10017556_18560 [Micromonospora sagamiensis]
MNRVEGTPARRERERFVVHLPVVATDLAAALRFARSITRAVSFLADVDRAETTVSAEDAQGVRHRVFCDRLFARGRRCPGLAGHDGDCGVDRHR